MIGFPKPESRKRTKAREKRADREQAQETRQKVLDRDGWCRVGRAGRPEIFGRCTPVPEWAHLVSRQKTRGMAPEIRHSTATSVMLCGGPAGGHHVAFDKLTGRKRLHIESLTAAGADGRLQFELAGIRFIEEE